MSISSEPKRIVLDTNVLISAAIYAQSLAAQSVTLAFAFGKVYRSQETFLEFKTVLNRSKFDPYFVDNTVTRAMFLSLYGKHSVEVAVTHTCTDCIDPKDNMFLSLALSAGAAILVSGDQKHLIPMHPYRGIAILLATDFVQMMIKNR